MNLETSSWSNTNRTFGISEKISQVLLFSDLCNDVWVMHGSVGFCLLVFALAVYVKGWEFPLYVFIYM